MKTKVDDKKQIEIASLSHCIRGNFQLILCILPPLGLDIGSRPHYGDFTLHSTN